MLRSTIANQMIAAELVLKNAMEYFPEWLLLLTLSLAIKECFTFYISLLLFDILFAFSQSAGFIIMFQCFNTHLTVNDIKYIYLMFSCIPFVFFKKFMKIYYSKSMHDFKFFTK